MRLNYCHGMRTRKERDQKMQKVFPQGAFFDLVHPKELIGYEKTNGKI